MAFYKKENGNWIKATKMLFPNNIEVTEDNKDEHQDLLTQYAWEWHDEPPQEYVLWIGQQEEI